MNWNIGIRFMLKILSARSPDESKIIVLMEQGWYRNWLRTLGHVVIPVNAFRIGNYAYRRIQGDMLDCQSLLELIPEER